MKNFCEDLFFFLEIAQKIFVKTFLYFFFFGVRPKNFCEDLFFFGEHLRLCPSSLALASSIPFLGLESVCPRKGCPWPRIFFVSLALASSLVSSTPPLQKGTGTGGKNRSFNFCSSVFTYLFQHVRQTLRNILACFWILLLTGSLIHVIRE